MIYDDVAITTTRLDVVKREVRMEFTRLHLQQAEVSVEDQFTGRLRVMASWKVAAQKARDTVRAPSDWWEAVKERWLPAWALRRWPVRYTEWRAYRILPAVDLPTPKLEGGYFDFVQEWAE